MTQHISNQNTTSVSPFFENPNTANPFFAGQDGTTLPVEDFMTDVSGGPLNIEGSKDVSSFNLRTMDPLSRPDSVLARLMTSGMLPAAPAKSSQESSIYAMPRDVAVQKPETTLAWSTTPRVLVVEGDQISRNLCAKYVQDSGCSVDLAFDGASAVNKMNVEKFDLVLMVRVFPPSLAHPRADCCSQDTTIPKLDGCSATSMIRQFNRVTPIVAISSDVKPSHVMAYFTAGMTDVLGKPLAKAEVIEILDVCCNFTFPLFHVTDRALQ